MSEESFSDDSIILALEPGQYAHAIGIAMGSAEVLREDGVHKFLTLVFLDCENNQVPILFSLDGNVLEYLLSEKFQTDLREQVSEIA